MYDISLFKMLTYFCVSSLSTFLAYKFIYRKFEKVTLNSKRPQNIHVNNTPRMGGLSLYITFCILAIISYLHTENYKNVFILLIIISTPVFLFGFLEDITQSISPSLRLIGSVLSSLLFILIFQNFVSKIGISIIDELLSFKLIGFMFTVFCITYLTQSFNIIDGLNGLSLITCILSLSTISLIAQLQDDFEILNVSISLISILVGILMYNFPYSKIFLGDSGAYLIGLILSAILIIFVNNNKTISPFVIAQIIIYPSYELLRSTIRRFFFDKTDISQPDLKHLHSIFYLHFLLIKSKSKIFSNTYASCTIILLQFINCCFIINFYQNERMIQIGIISFIIIYEILYYRIFQRIKMYNISGI